MDNVGYAYIGTSTSQSHLTQSFLDSFGVNVVIINANYIDNCCSGKNMSMVAIMEMGKMCSHDLILCHYKCTSQSRSVDKPLGFSNMTDK